MLDRLNVSQFNKETIMTNKSIIKETIMTNNSIIKETIMENKSNNKSKVLNILRRLYMFRVPKSYSLVYKGRFGKYGVVHVMYHMETSVFVVRMSGKKNMKIVTFNYEDKAMLIAYMNNLLGW